MECWPAIKGGKTGEQDFPFSAKVSRDMDFHPSTVDVLTQHFSLHKVCKGNFTIRIILLHHSC